MLLMGIINTTPDSFADGGQFLDTDSAVDHALRLAGEGAETLDIGGESSRPGSEPVPEEEELRRVIPVIERLAKRGESVISVDTQKPAVAKAALDQVTRQVDRDRARDNRPGVAKELEQAVLWLRKLSGSVCEDDVRDCADLLEAAGEVDDYQLRFGMSMRVTCADGSALKDLASRLREFADAMVTSPPGGSASLIRSHRSSKTPRYPGLLFSRWLSEADARSQVLLMILSKP